MLFGQETLSNQILSWHLDFQRSLRSEIHATTSMWKRPKRRKFVILWPHLLCPSRACWSLACRCCTCFCVWIWWRCSCWAALSSLSPTSSGIGEGGRSVAGWNSPSGTWSWGPTAGASRPPLQWNGRKILQLPRRSDARLIASQELRHPLPLWSRSRPHWCRPPVRMSNSGFFFVFVSSN